MTWTSNENKQISRERIRNTTKSKVVFGNRRLKQQSKILGGFQKSEA